jgi:hypothetical protein
VVKGRRRRVVVVVVVVVVVGEGAFLKHYIYWKYLGNICFCSV